MLLDILKAVVLGAVEGITEFLPVSSTGHLIIINQWLSFDADFTKVFDIVIQLGAVLSVVVYFWERLWPFSKDKEKNRVIWRIWPKVLFAVIPALGIGVLLASAIEERLFNPITVSIMLVLGGAALIFLERRKKEATISSIASLSWRAAISIGFIQCLAMVPGTSRSAATIIGAMLLGASRTVAAEFSFFLAVPTMFAAAAYSLKKYDAPMTDSEMTILVVGFIVSFLVALAVIRFFMGYIQKHTFKNFGYYRMALGIFLLVLFSLGLIN
jgi:undecaprenyl-diphosphatase